MSAITLNMRSLRALSKKISVPRYDRSKLRAGILHIGVGNFHRAHQATYLDKLFSLGYDHDWAVVGTSVLKRDSQLRNALERQDFLSIVVEVQNDASNLRVNGSMIDFLPIVPQAIITTLLRPEIRIVTITITEGGYFIDMKNDGFDIDNPAIVHDIQHPNEPKTVFGILLAALKLRRAAGLAPFTIVSCDNLPSNSWAARRAILALAQCAPNKDVAGWIAETVAFPNSLVDCITPASGAHARELVAERYGIIDDYPVICEPYRQWFLEDNFPTGRPALERVGATFVKDVRGYEMMKLRILNGSHTSIAYVAALLGYNYIHLAVADATVRAFVEQLMHREVIPTLPRMPDIDYGDYLQSVLDRFSNSGIQDTVLRVAQHGSDKHQKFILGTIEDRLRSGQSIDGLALEIALWCYYCATTEGFGDSTDQDVHAGELAQAARAARIDSRAFLGLRNIFGYVGEDAVFIAEFERALAELYDSGIIPTLRRFIQSSLSR